MLPERIVTADGSHSLRSDRFGVTYHSHHGALQESRHIFIEAGLLPLLRTAGRSEVRIVEMGLGTGLNALLTRLVAREHPGVAFSYTSYERYPVDNALAAALNYCKLLGVADATLQDIHAAPWGAPTVLEPNFTLTKFSEDFLSATPPEATDLIYYDAFAPEDQPELWTTEAMCHCGGFLRADGGLVTYCAKGQFKRNLRAAGFRVEALPGPVGKREITRATRAEVS